MVLLSVILTISGAALLIPLKGTSLTDILITLSMLLNKNVMVNKSTIS